jgi:hypothetical protein
MRARARARARRQLARQTLKCAHADALCAARPFRAIRLVSTSGGGYSILGAALGPTAWFRHAGWVHIQVLVPARADAAWSPLVYVSGAVALANRRVSLLPRRFYVLASARTSGGTDDAHSIARVRLDCAPDGWRADAHPPWTPSAEPPPPAGATPRGVGGSPGISAGASMGAALGVLGGVGLLACGTVVVRRRRRRARRDSSGRELLLSADGKGTSLAPMNGGGGGAGLGLRSTSWEMGTLRNNMEEPFAALAVGSMTPDRGGGMIGALGGGSSASLGGGGGGGGGGASLTGDDDSCLRTFGFDVFLSYRRLDGRLVDAVQDKLLLNALRVFKDVNGHMAGRPFDVELFRVIRDSAVFAPVLTIEGMRRLAALTPDVADFTLAEYVTALYFFDAGDIPLVYPLAVGAESTNAQGKPEWDKLFESPQFKQYRDALPEFVPTATLKLVNSVFLKILGHPLPEPFCTLTVREVMLGRVGDATQPQLPGLFSFDLYFLMCLQEDLALHIEGRFARNIRAALQQAERRGWKRRVRDSLPAND